MSNASDFVIENDILKKYVGSGGFLAVPDGVVAIGTSAFENCDKLKGVTMPQSLKRIGRYAFSNCKNLKTISLKEGLLSIEKEAFLGCAALCELVIPVSVAAIGDDAFKGCGKISSFFAPGISPSILKDKMLTQIAVMTFLARREEYVRPDIVAEYQQLAAKHKKNILPNLFKFDLAQSLSSYVSSVKIAPKIFEEELLNPAADANATECVAFLLKWKNENMKGKTQTQSLTKELAKDPLTATEMKKLWSFEKLPDGTMKITGYKGEETDLVIPERIGQAAVTSVGEGAFSPDKARRPKAQAEAMKAIRSMTVPESVTTIGNYAFSGCKNLRKIAMADSVKIGECAFLGCKKLADASGLVLFAQRVFDYSGNNANVVVPNGVVAIEPCAFKQNKKVVSVSLPESIESIGSNAFEKCYELQSINIPAKVSSIESETFRWCKNLQTIHGLKNVKTIGDEAFSNCAALRATTAPHVVKLGHHAFYKCENLEFVDISQQAQADVYAFSNCKKLADECGFSVVAGVLYDYSGIGGDVVIPDGVKEIHNEAFADCGDLRSVTIPRSVIQIAGTAFRYRETHPAFENMTVSVFKEREIVIHAPAGSYAETYAKENNIPFVAE